MTTRTCSRLGCMMRCFEELGSIAALARPRKRPLQPGLGSPNRSAEIVWDQVVKYWRWMHCMSEASSPDEWTVQGWRQIRAIGRRTLKSKSYPWLRKLHSSHM
eukprot:363400-Chlamydomonas_euryale.AAC.8